jgi:hypothetical protein
MEVILLMMMQYAHRGDDDDPDELDDDTLDYHDNKHDAGPRPSRCCGGAWCHPYTYPYRVWPYATLSLPLCRWWAHVVTASWATTSMTKSAPLLQGSQRYPSLTTAKRDSALLEGYVIMMR